VTGNLKGEGRANFENMHMWHTKKPVRRSMDKLRLCTGENPDKTGVGGECAKRNIHLAGSVPFRKVDIYTCHRFILPGKTLALNSSDNFSSLLIFFMSLGYYKFVSSACFGED
jgi:hypothetical protein